MVKSVGLLAWLTLSSWATSPIEARGWFEPEGEVEPDPLAVITRPGRLVGPCQSNGPEAAQVGSEPAWQVLTPWGTATWLTPRRWRWVSRRRSGPGCRRPGWRRRLRHRQPPWALAPLKANGIAPRPSALTAAPVPAVPGLPLRSDSAWAAQQWGLTELGDKRRSRRAVQMGAAMAAHPGGSIPEQMESLAATKAAYRLLNEPEVSFEKLSQPHWQQTRQAAGQHRLVLMIQDTTELDYTAHPTVQGLGPVGTGRGRGFLLHSVLVCLPDPPTILGLAHQHPLLRQARLKGQRHPKWMQTPEALVWETATAAVGQPPPECTWVHVGDRGSDSFGFMAACDRLPGIQCLLRLTRNRPLDWSSPSATEAGDDPPGEPEGKLMDFVRSLPPRGQPFSVEVSPRRGEPRRQATLQLSWAAVTIPAPQGAPTHLGWPAHVSAWVVRAWELQPPAEVTPLEWVLLSSLPVRTWGEARQRVAWYADRWLIEEYHRALKTGCRVEQAQFDQRQDLERLLGFLALIAVRLLQLRHLAQQAPHTPAQAVLDPLEVRLLAAQVKTDPATMTVAQFWLGLAQLGGHQGRRGDGPPGWLTLWRGRRKLQLMMQGARLALGLDAPNPSGLSILLLSSP